MMRNFLANIKHAQRIEILQLNWKEKRHVLGQVDCAVSMEPKCSGILKLLKVFLGYNVLMVFKELFNLVKLSLHTTALRHEVWIEFLCPDKQNNLPHSNENTRNTFLFDQHHLYSCSILWCAALWFALIDSYKISGEYHWISRLADDMSDMMR